MEYSGKRADRFQRNGWLQEKEMKKIIKEVKRAEEERGNRDIDSNAHAAEHAAAREAITEGLLQPHGTPPNTIRTESSNCYAKIQTALTTESRGTTSIARPSILKMNSRRMDYYTVNTV
jgi:hypothetical protein